MPQPHVRPARDDDAPGIVALVGRCWADYPGVILDLETEERRLLALATYYAEAGGAVWVAEDDGIVGLAACTAEGGIEKMYVHPDRHGAGLGAALLATATAHAGPRDLVLWTETRFVRAHAFYEKHGWVRSGPLRACGDLSHSIEYEYVRPWSGVRTLGPAAAASAARRLGDILAACVNAGASVSFIPPITPAAARAYFAGVAARTDCILLAAWSHGVLAGTVRVDPAPQQNQPHRADIAKMLVHPDARRAGLGTALLAGAEAAALAVGRTLLVLDTEQGSAGRSPVSSPGLDRGGRHPGLQPGRRRRRTGDRVVLQEASLPPRPSRAGVRGQRAPAIAARRPEDNPLSSPQKARQRPWETVR